MATFWSGRPGWLGKLGIALLATWLLILIISVLHVFKTNSISSQDGNPTNKENAQRLAQMINDFEILKKQNDGLKNIILRYVNSTILRYIYIYIHILIIYNTY